MTNFYADLLYWLEKTSGAHIIRQSLWLYPAITVVHLVGIILLVGPAFLFDLRLLGFNRDLSVKILANHLLLWSRRGLWLVVPSGFLLFITDAQALGIDPTFWLKMGLLLLAGLNALVFHTFTFSPDGGPGKATSMGGKVAALFSIGLWLGVIICGRWLAY